MNRVKFAVVAMGLGWLLIAGCVMAQATAGQSTAAESTAATAAAEIPLDQQATKEQLGRLFVVMRLRQQFDSMMKAMPQMVQQQIHAQMQEELANTPGARKLTPEQQAALEKLMDKYMEKAKSIYPVDEMIDDAATIYQRHMSRSDVDAYIAFYSSPPGQRLLDAQPAILKEYVPMAMQRVQERSKQLNVEMAVDVQKFIASQRPAEAPPAAGPATK
ncbi:MAG TPA: DUF2059 domain-containing protein [Terracidiphilus sp.]|jgi:hypothetical protein